LVLVPLAGDFDERRRERFRQLDLRSPESQRALEGNFYCRGRPDVQGNWVVYPFGELRCLPVP
jgi:hypothetical protein